MEYLLLQEVSTKEIRTVKHAVALSDKDEYTVYRSDMQMISEFYDKSYIPIGSVEFVREFMRINNIKEPEINPYPIRDYKFLQRNMSNSTHSFDELLRYGVTGGIFIKPKKLKLFTGFVLDTNEKYENVSERTKEELWILLQNANEQLYVSDVVDFLSEWRYYIQGGKIIGYARYDEEGEENAPEPDVNVVEEYASLLNISHPYVLDFGVISTGQTGLVEYNDFWSLGLYGDAISPKQYLNCLVERWKSILGD